jgi:transcriptional regulator with XRE-family HTH domain
MNIANTIGNRLKLLREARDESQDEFSKLMGESQKDISNWENDRGEPSLKALVLLQEKTGCSWRWLTLGEGEMIEKAPDPSEVFKPGTDREWAIHYKAKYEVAEKRIEKCDGEIKDVLMRIADKK